MRIAATALSLTVDDVAASAGFLVTHFGFREAVAADGFASLAREDAPGVTGGMSRRRRRITGPGACAPCFTPQYCLRPPRSRPSSCLAWARFLGSDAARRPCAIVRRPCGLLAYCLIRLMMPGMVGPPFTVVT